MTAPPIRLAAFVVALGVVGWACGAGDPGGGGGGAGAGAGTSGGGGSGPGGGGGTTTTGGAGSSVAGQGAGGQGGTAAPPDGGGDASGGASATDGGGGDGARADGPGGSAGDGAPGTAPLTQFLRIIQVTTVQGTTTVSISIDGQKNHSGAIHVGQALMMRIHVRPDTGWVAHPTVAELRLVNAAGDVIVVSAARTITGASSAGNIDSTFNFDLTAAQVTADLKFSVALRDPTGTPENPPPAIQRALYPRNGTLDTLDAQ